MVSTTPYFFTCIVLVLFFKLPTSSSFLSTWPVDVVSFASSQSNRNSNRVYSISEWRDLIFDYPGTGDDRRIGIEQGAPPREINILPFPYDQALLQGETKQLRLYEERFIKLFDDTMERHCGVVAMGLLAQAGIIQKVPLCEIEAYNRMDSTFGIFVTIRVVGRAQLLQFVQQEPYIKAVCLEISDKVPPNLELPNILANNVEESLSLLSKMESRLEEAQKQNADGNDKIKRRLNRAKLEDRLYEEGEEEEEEESELDRERRFQKAYRIALATDTQGYYLSGTDFSGSKYSPQELTALSWAAFCTDDLPEMGATFRIQALDCEDLFERLKLATHMLRQKEAQLKEKLVKAGLDLDGEEGSNDGDRKQ